MDMEGFKDLFADDGVIRASAKTYQGDKLASILYFAEQLVPDVHREILRVHTIGNFVVVEMAFRGTFTGTFDTPTGTIKGNGAKVDVGEPSRRIQSPHEPRQNRRAVRV